MLRALLNFFRPRGNGEERHVRVPLSSGDGTARGRPARLRVSAGLLILLMGLSGCAASYEYHAPASPQPSNAAPEPAPQTAGGTSTAASSESGDAKSPEKKAGNSSEPPPKTIEEAVCRYFCQLHDDCSTSKGGGDVIQPQTEPNKSDALPPKSISVPPPAPAAESAGTSHGLPIDPNKNPISNDESATYWASFAPSPDIGPTSLQVLPSGPNSGPADATNSQPGKSGQPPTPQSAPSAGDQNTLQEQPTFPAPRTARSGLIEPSPGGPSNPEALSWLSAHFQTTVVSEIHDHFTSPYIGPNSLLPHEPQATSETSTLFLDTRIWKGGEVIFNPEVAGGTGFSSVTGIADFPNEEITRVGKPQPTPYVARLLFKQTWGLGGEQETVADGANQLAEKRDIDRVTFYIGKMAFTDIMDNNAYSHDARSQMLGWAMTFNGAWDFPADVRGYDYGMAIDFNHKWWALRYGIFGEPDVANGEAIDDHVLKANGQALEWEGRWKLNDHPGAVRVMGYLNLAHMGSYRDAVAEMPVNPNIIDTRAWRIKYGFCANLEQEITKELGFWARLGWNDGHTETWAFTSIDDSLAFGFLLKGKRWHRPDDEVGLGFIIDGLSAAHREYLAAGGLDFIIGDGKLNYAPEEVLETYYNLQIIKGIEVTGDFQLVNDPAYNEDRGPVAIASIRVHFEF